MPSDKAGRVIFIGNIPYGLSEEQIIELCRQAGPVNSFRLVYDKETAKPKGFGFAEFRDADAAASAVRNLNGYEIMGRTLRVDYSNDTGSGDSGAPGGDVPHQANGLDSAPAAASLPVVPQGTDLPPNLTCPDAISRTLSSLPPPQLLDVISQMKGVAMSDPAKATELFRNNPQLSYAMFQALLLLGLVDTSVLASVVSQQQNRPQPPAAVPPPQATYHNPLAPGTQTLAGIATPPAPAQFAATPAPPTMFPPGTDMNAIRQQVLSVSQTQLDAMTPESRDQILRLRQGFMTGVWM